MEMRAIYANTMAELMRADRHVCILDADLSKASGTLGLYKDFPDQMIECGIASFLAVLPEDESKAEIQ